jgi:hypothetical protein
MNGQLDSGRMSGSTSVGRMGEKGGEKRQRGRLPEFLPQQAGERESHRGRHIPHGLAANPTARDQPPRLHTTAQRRGIQKCSSCRIAASSGSGCPVPSHRPRKAPLPVPSTCTCSCLAVRIHVQRTRVEGLQDCAGLGAHEVHGPRCHDDDDEQGVLRDAGDHSLHQLLLSTGQGEVAAVMTLHLHLPTSPPAHQPTHKNDAGYPNYDCN